MKRDVKAIIAQMTLEEKAGLCSGFDFWHTKSVDRLGIPSIMMTDGPHGLRKQEANADHLGLHESVPSTCFPTAAALACSWDRKLLEKVGIALGKECQAERVSIILGPGANIKRSPLCGRNFEYFSEDPYLTGELAASHIAGVQSQGIGTSLKHYAANNQEEKRLVIDVQLDERTLREIYLTGFEIAIKKSQPWTVMCAYNKLDGVYCSENPYLLTDILRNEWDFDGFVVSDWGAVNHRVEGLKAGLELEMPSSGGLGDGKIVNAVKNGELEECVLDRAVERLLNIIYKAADNYNKDANYDKEQHHKLAREVAGECMVLLKNDNNILPLKQEGSLAIIGAFAKNPRFQGGGSSHINPTQVDSAFDEIKKLAEDSMDIYYADGYKLDEKAGMFGGKVFESISDIPDEQLISEAKMIAEKSDVALVFAGLPDSYESEGYDRKHLKIPEGQRRLIEEVAKTNKKTIVVLSNGSPIEMPWLDKVAGVFEGYLGGQASGGAIADLLFGINNPCGKLTETFPKRLEDNPSYLNFPGDAKKVEYREGIYVGYRYYDAKNMEVLFPFGYGLSYTNFEYTGISLDKDEILDTDRVKVNIKVKNIGDFVGKEIVQLYVKDLDSDVLRPEKELKGFEKVLLNPGEEKTVTFTLDKRAFAYYNEEVHDWYVGDGYFEILVGGSSYDLPLKAKLKVKPAQPIKKVYDINSTLGEIMADPKGAAIIQNAMKNSPMSGTEEDMGGGMAKIAMGMPLRSILMFAGGSITEEMINGLLDSLNG